jgi:predicted methyltransferase
MMNRKFSAAALLAPLLLSACAAYSSADPTPASYAAALADPARSAADRERDAVRKPAELMAFAQIAPGEQVGDFVMGGGYLTRALAAAVGPTGKVHAFQPAEFIAFRKEYGTEQNDTVATRANIVAVGGRFEAPAFSVPLDTIVTVQNFHDLYLKPFPEGTGARGSAALFAALKPGGTLLVVDHSAADGSGTRDAHDLHRIDKAAVIAALTAAGFKLEAESDIYRQPADPRTANVFSPAIRGKTDQFMLRFRKPK